MANTIASANAVFLLSITGVFNNPVQLSGFGPDAAFDTAAVDTVVTQLGVDGMGVAGWVPQEIDQTITLLAASPSNAIFDQWKAYQDSIADAVYAAGSIRIPSLGVQYTMPQGVLKRYPPVADARRVMMPRVFVITWLPQPGVPAITSAPI